MSTNWNEWRQRMGLDKEPGLITQVAALAYVKGYILALEDTVKDVDTIRADIPDEEQNVLLFRVQDKIFNSLEQAHATSAHLRPFEDHLKEVVEQETEHDSE